MKNRQKSARTPRIWFAGSIDHNVDEGHQTSPIELPKQTAHHLLTVLRANDGDTIELFNGDGSNYSATLSRAGKKAFAVLQSVQPNGSESPLTTQLVQSISRGEKMDASVRQSVELGVSAIQPIYTRHSIPELKGERATRKQEHWHSIAISAAEQSGRSVVPEILPALSLSGWLKTRWVTLREAGYTGWVLDPTSGQNLSNATTTHASAIACHAPLIGPEIGLEPSEIEQAVDSGFIRIQFGPRILRTETAGPAVLSALQAIAGDLLA